jgi:hypothetical protein
MVPTKEQVRGIAPKLFVTAIAIAALGMHLSGRAKLDTTALALIGMAILPWLTSILTRAELPGGLKFEFQQVKAEQWRQAQEIDAIKFLLAHFVTEHECRHLEGLAQDNPYFAKFGPTTNYFEMEMRRLKALGFITGLRGRGLRSLFRAIREANGGEVNVREHFEVAPRGKDYLQLRHEMLAEQPGATSV